MSDFGHPLSFSMCEQFVKAKVVDEKSFFDKCEKWAEQQIGRSKLRFIYSSWLRAVDVLQELAAGEVSPACANYFERNFYILQCLRFFTTGLKLSLWSEEHSGDITLLYIFKEFVLHEITNYMIAEVQEVQTVPHNKDQLWDAFVMSLRSADWNEKVDVLPFSRFYRCQPEKNDQYLNKIHTFRYASLKVSEYRHVDNVLIAMVEILKEKAQKLLVLHTGDSDTKRLQWAADSIEKYAHAFQKAYPNASTVREAPIWIDPYKHYNISLTSKTENSTVTELCSRIERNWKYQLSFMYYFPNASKNI